MHRRDVFVGGAATVTGAFVGIGHVGHVAQSTVRSPQGFQRRRCRNALCEMP
ncbi:MAG: hypothetical protein RLZ84_1722 [Actinomycetota bacterium]